MIECTVFDMKQKFIQRSRTGVTAECHLWILLRQKEVLFHPPLPTPSPHPTPNRHHSSLSLSSLWTNRFCHSPLLLLGCTTTMTCHNVARPVRLYTNRDTLTSVHTLSLPENRTSHAVKRECFLLACLLFCYDIRSHWSTTSGGKSLFLTLTDRHTDTH